MPYGGKMKTSGAYNRKKSSKKFYQNEKFCSSKYINDSIYKDNARLIVEKGV